MRVNTSLTNVAPGVILEDEDYDLKTKIDGLPRGGSDPTPINIRRKHGCGCSSRLLSTLFVKQFRQRRATGEPAGTLPK